jgi:hypothetical protein
MRKVGIHLTHRSCTRIEGMLKPGEVRRAQALAARAV